MVRVLPGAPRVIVLLDNDPGVFCVWGAIVILLAEMGGFLNKFELRYLDDRGVYSLLYNQLNMMAGS